MDKKKQNNLQDDRETMIGKLCCWFGLHKYSKWRKRKKLLEQARYCERCNIKKHRRILI